MNPTSRMVALLTAFRRERNGAVADAMRCYGVPCGLNYGVSIPTVRQIARAEAPDNELARLLWRQDVRELRLAALHIADPAAITPEDLSFWAEGICNSELAEEAAFALLGRIGSFPVLFGRWLAADKPLLRYAALLAAGRSAARSAAMIAPALEAVRRTAAKAPDAARLTAQGAVALLAAIETQDEKCRQEVLRSLDTLGESPAEELIREELAWRLYRE